MKKAFCKMCVTICGRFCPDEGVVAGYDNRIRAKYTAKWGVQIAGMLFQTRSSTCCLLTDFQLITYPAYGFENQYAFHRFQAATEKMYVVVKISLFYVGFHAPYAGE